MRDSSGRRGVAVLAVIALGTALVSLSLPDGDRRALNQDAERLAAQLEAERSWTTIVAAGGDYFEMPLDGRLAAFRRQLAEERAKIAGGAGSLATKFSEYETLAAERTLAERAMAAASTALDTARLDARRQKLYLERIVSPSVADKATEPNRFRAILMVLISTLLIYGIGWLVWAGLREHRQL